MGLLDTLKSKLGQHPDKASKGIDKAASTIDEKTGGKHSSQVSGGAEKAKDHLGVGGEQQPGRAPEAAPGQGTEPPAGGPEPGREPPQP